MGHIFVPFPFPLLFLTIYYCLYFKIRACGTVKVSDFQNWRVAGLSLGVPLDLWRKGSPPLRQEKMPVTFKGRSGYDSQVHGRLISSG